MRLYEMFLGPLEQAKPWNTNGIDGVYRFIRKFWRLFYKDSPAGTATTGEGEWIVTDENPTPAELKVLHRLHEGELARALGIQLGFNAHDGD